MEGVRETEDCVGSLGLVSFLSILSSLWDFFFFSFRVENFWPLFFIVPSSSSVQMLVLDSRHL